MTNGQLISEIEPAIRGRCRAVALNSTGQQLLIGGAAERGGVVVDANTGKKLFVHNAPTKTITHVAFTPDDKRVIISDEEHTLYQYPVLGGFGSPQPMLKAEREKLFAFVGGTLCNYAVMNTSSLSVRSVPQTIVSPTMIWTGPLRTGSPDNIRLAPGERFLLICDQNRNLEVRATDVMNVAWSANLRDLPGAVALSADGRTLAMGMPDGGIKFCDFMVAIDPPARLVTRHLREMLEKKKYADLEAIAARLEHETQPLAWFPNISPYEAFCELLTLTREAPVSNDGLLAAIGKWHRSRPDSTLAKILRAKQHINTAWQYRGGGYANTVSESDWKHFHDHIAKAGELLEPLCQNNAAPPAAFTQLFTVATAESWTAQQWRPYWQRVFAAAPQDCTYHCRVANKLMLRWGGQPGECKTYAAEVADAIGGAAGDAMYARIAVHLWDRYFPDDRALDEPQFDYARVNRGLLHLTDTSSDGKWAGHMGLRLAYGRKDRSAAQLFAGKLKGDVRHWQPGWWNHENDVVSALRFAQ